MRKNVSLYVRLLSMAAAAGCVAIAGFTGNTGAKGSGISYAAGKQKEYTVLVYMIGSDLESTNGAASNDIEEMTETLKRSQGKLDECVNIVVEYGGSTEWRNSTLAEAGFLHGRFELTQDGIENLTRLPEASMGEESVLQDFLAYGTANYPAEDYLLIFWDHGEGPVIGYGSDALYRGDSLTLAEIARSFQASGMENYHFPFIGFDACLMGGIETAYIMPENVDYLVASAEEEPTDGWNYAWLAVLEEPEADGEKIGRTIVDSYMDYYKERDSRQPLTLGVFECRAARALGENLSENLYSTRKEEGNVRFYQRLSAERGEYYSYNQSLFSRIADIVDLKELSESVVLKETMREEFDRLYNDTVVYVKTENLLEDACGFSVYLPSKTNLFIEQDMDVYKTVPFAAGYKEFAGRYVDHLMGKSDPDIDAEQITWEEDRLFLTMEKPEEFSRINGRTFLYDEETEQYLLLAETGPLLKEGSAVSFTAAEECIRMNGVPMYGCPVGQEEGISEYLCPVLYDGKAVQLQLRFSGEKGTVIGTYLMESAGGKTDLCGWEDGGAVTPLYPAYVLQGEELKEAFGDRSSVIIRNHAYQKGNTIVFSKDREAEIDIGTIEQPNLFYGFGVTDLRLEEYCCLAPMP